MSDSNDLVIVREFNAPRERVWDAWTTPEGMMKWWGPKGFTCPVSKIDFRVGGKYLFCMRSPDGQDFWSTGTYREIVPMEKIVCTDSFSDAEGNIVSGETYGMAGLPLEFEITVTFEEIDGKTKMTLQHVGFSSDTMKEQASAGWNGSFDKLEASL